jgi:S1-C subfamily serine protease
MYGRKMARTFRVIAAASLWAVVLAACSSTHSTTPSQPASSTTASTAAASGVPSAGAAALQQDFVSVVNKVRPSVVEISTQSGLGSGVVFDTQGNIVTNFHVVGSATATDLKVTFFDGQTVPATLVGTYQPDDLAVVKVTRAKGVNPATFADSSKLQIGDIALAIGNPLGLASSVTEGIVSVDVTLGNLSG